MLDAIEEGYSTSVLAEDSVTTKTIEGFMGGHGRSFYGLVAEKSEFVELHKSDEHIVNVLRAENVEVVPFRNGGKTWSLCWN